MTGLLLTGGCNCGVGATGLVGNHGAPSTLPALQFGNVQVGQSADLQLPLSNEGGAPLGITSQTIAGSDFALAVPLGTDVPVGADGTAVVRFTPSRTGPTTGTLLIDDDGEPTSLTVALSGSGVTLALAVDPASLDFGKVAVGTAPSPTRTLTFQNNNPQPVYLSISTSSTASEFAVTNANGPPAALAPSTSTSVNVSFAPDRASAFSSKLDYLACEDAAGKTCLPLQAVLLSGEGIGSTLQFSPSPISFNGTPLGTTAQQTVTVTNVGNAAASVGCVFFQSLGPCDTATDLFSLGGNAGPLTAPVAPGASFQFQLSYTANDAGTDALVVSYGAAGTTSSFSASDQIDASNPLTPCEVTVTPASLSFNKAVPGAPQMQSVTLSNNGETACTISNVGIAPTSDPSYALVSGQPTSLSLAPGASAAIGVAFDLNNNNPPQSRAGQLTFASTDPNQLEVNIPLLAYVAALESCGTQTDTFTIPRPKLDLIWVIDNDDDDGQSGIAGGSGTYATLIAGLPTIFQALSAVDFHMAVLSDAVVYDDGSFLPCSSCIESGSAPEIITSSDTNPEAELAGVILNIPQTLNFFDGDERMLDSVYLALQPGMLSGPNAGFLRSDASLDIIAVEGDEEDDASVITNADACALFLWGLKGGAGGATFSYFLNYIPQAVLTGVPVSFANLSTIQQAMGGGAVNLSDGAFWPTELASRLYGISQYNYGLSQQPLGGTITVNVNGSPYSTSHWTYDSSTNQIDFSVLPSAGSTVVVTYNTPC